MVRFSYVARIPFFMTVLLHLPNSADAFMVASKSSSLWGVVVLPNKKNWQQQHQQQTQSSVQYPSSKHSLDATPTPPDTPPPPFFFVQQVGDDDNDEDDEAMEDEEDEDDTDESVSFLLSSSSTTTTTTKATLNSPISPLTTEDFEEFKRISKEWGDKAVEYMIVSIVNSYWIGLVWKLQVSLADSV
jgi:hypothetical protein